MRMRHSNGYEIKRAAVKINFGGGSDLTRDGKGLLAPIIKSRHRVVWTLVGELSKKRRIFAWV